MIYSGWSSLEYENEIIIDTYSNSINDDNHRNKAEFKAFYGQQIKNRIIPFIHGTNQENMATFLMNKGGEELVIVVFIHSKWALICV